MGCLRSPGATPKYVNVSIVNLHWHTPSEHTLNGRRPCIELFALKSGGWVPPCGLALALTYIVLQASISGSRVIWSQRSARQMCRRARSLAAWLSGECGTA